MNDDALDPETRAFYTRHCSTPGGVVIAHIYDGDGEEIATGVFSTIDKAMEWRGQHPDEATAAIFAPYVIDHPNFGNVPAERMN